MKRKKRKLYKLIDKQKGDISDNYIFVDYHSMSDVAMVHTVYNTVGVYMEKEALRDYIEFVEKQQAHAFRELK